MLVQPCSRSSASSDQARDAERFIEEVRGDEPELARHLRIEERELEELLGGLFGSPRR
jgi:hypothetical protein